MYELRETESSTEIQIPDKAYISASKQKQIMKMCYDCQPSVGSSIRAATESVNY